MSKTIFKGAASALITPFFEGEIDFTSLGALIDDQIKRGIAALVVSGTTGESATLSDEEKAAIYEFSVRRVGGRVPVIAGSGTNDTRRAVELSRAAERAGCDALLVVTPYYNKASSEGLYRHYKVIANATTLPCIAYNVPSRTGVNIPIEVLQRLSSEGLVTGLKEASGDLSRVAKIAAACPELTLYSGNDDQILPILALGGQGVISVVSNLLPEKTQRLCDAYFEGKTEEARNIQLELLPLITLLFKDVNPIPVKYMLASLGVCRPEYRLPLTKPQSELASALALAALRL